MEDDYEKLVKKSRYFLKDSIRKTINFAYTDQNKGIAPSTFRKALFCRCRENKTSSF